MWSNRNMELPPSLSYIPESERTPLVKWLLKLIAQQQVVIEQQQSSLDKMEAQVGQLEQQLKKLEEELKATKQLPKKPKIQASRLNQPEKSPAEFGKRAGSAKRSNKTSNDVDEQRVIEPKALPEGARFNGYREYDVQDLIVLRHNVRLLLAEYVTSFGKTIAGEVPPEYQGHYGATLVSFVLYQHHQCRVPQPLILEELREFGIDISAGQVNRILIEQKESFHAEQQAVLSAGLETAEYVHTDDTGARHQGQNGSCTVIGNDLFAHFSSTGSKSRQNFLRILRGPHQDFVFNEYAHSYLLAQQLPQCHLTKLQFSLVSQIETEADWQGCLQRLGITSQQAVKLLTEAALLLTWLLKILRFRNGGYLLAWGDLLNGTAVFLFASFVGSAIEHGLSPELIILSDGARQFNLLVHALCWIHMERGIRARVGGGILPPPNSHRLPGKTARHRQQIQEVQTLLWKYYRQLRHYQDHPEPTQKPQLSQRFDDIFDQRYPRHAGLNLVLQQFCAHKPELLRVLDTHKLALHTNAAESDIREYVTRRQISGGTRHADGRRVRDTFTGLKKTCRKLAYSFWQYLLSRLQGKGSVPYLPDVIRSRATAEAEILSRPLP